MDDTFRSLRRGFLRALLVVVAVCPLSGCEQVSSAWTAVVNFFIPSPPIYLDQGWTEIERTGFYYTTQGSRLIRRDWFLALERHDSNDRFLDDGLKRFGYLEGSVRPPFNLDKLPIGFAVDPPLPLTGEWIGMTCAACHTSEITFGAKKLRVDGAPAAADMYEFLSKLGLALKKAADDDAAFARFAGKVLGANDTPANRQTLRDHPSTGLRKFSTDFAAFVAQSTPASPWGPARLDAFGMIFNRVTSIDLGIPSNSQKPNAPVSYPFLWGTSHHEWTQWNGAVPNGGGLVLGPTRRLARNVGQVLGVFGTLDFSSTPTYSSSANRITLPNLEQWVSTLKAPPWPSDIFGAPDPAKVARGKLLYDATCIGCHKRVPINEQLQNAEVRTIALGTIGTDDAMTTMVATRRVPSAGVLQGRPLQVFLGRGIGPNELATDLLSHAVIGAMTHIDFRPDSTPPTTPPIDALFDSSVVVGYKARPLNGIWATGPYLHNGSVRTLFQLLLPVARRDPSFHVGGREFDPVEVGFKNAPGVVNFQLDTTVAGNRNSGHSFADGLTDPQRMDLVEYLKTL